jgi:hypothetical protein
MTRYNRQNPSPRYQELLAMYCSMHAEGDSNAGIAAENMFAGISLPPQALRIKDMIRQINAQSTLDYGCGKAILYRTSPIRMADSHESFDNIQTFWGVQETLLFDPAYKPYSQFPSRKADIVICTDVMEHCPKEDVIWILKEIFSLANKGVYLNISCYPASKHLPNGENAHCTIQPQHWWQGALNYVSAFHPDIQWQCWLDVIVNNQKRAVLLKK